jgi:hypothetical protein
MPCVSKPSFSWPTAAATGARTSRFDPRRNNSELYFLSVREPPGAGLRARKESAEVEDRYPPVLFFRFFFLLGAPNRHIERQLEARLLAFVPASLLFFALPDLFDDERG